MLGIGRLRHRSLAPWAAEHSEASPKGRASLSFLVFLSLVVFLPLFSFAADGNFNQEQLARIDKTKTEFSFVVLGDTRDSYGRFDKVVESLNSKELLFIVINGDFVSHGEEEEFVYFLGLIKKVKSPLLTVIGSHEIERYAKYNYRKFFGSTYYSFSVGKSYFIILDDSDDYCIDMEQFLWLERELKKAKEYKQRFVIMHVPLYDPRAGAYEQVIGHSLLNLDCAKELNDLFDFNLVSQLFCSHIHGYFRGAWRRTPYIITGGGGTALHGFGSEHFFYHYIKVNVSKDKVDYEVVRLE